MENNSKPILTDRQKVQQDLFMDGLVHFLEIAGRIQDAVVRKELKGMQTIHLAFLRRASVHGYVSFDRIRADTGLPRYAI